MNKYILKKVNAPMTINDERWEKAEVAKLEFRWNDYFPSPYTTEARAVHCDHGITVRLKTTEWPVRACITEINGEVCTDSCMEFFVIPNTKEEKYLNFEINPIGTLHLGYGEGRHNRQHLDFAGKGIELTTAVTVDEGWCAMMHIPYSFLKDYYASCEKTMRANFYKCGDKTVNKHYSVWNDVELPKPDYHRPEFFGTLTLSDEEI